ncbi:MAG: energy transducer TonB [Prevotellaceae bacterium]|jgi:TonB family protein|nr:energy transducer TonB [Prevotellaceae bacterium]
MIYKIKFNIFTLLFRAFAWLADQTGGWAVFAKPKIVFGTLVLGLGITACGNTPNSSENVSENIDTSKFIIKVKPDSVKMDTVKEFSNETAGIIIEPEIHYPISCYVPAPIDMEYLPSFPENVVTYLQKNFRYPVLAAESGIQGTTVCSFMVNVDGSISDIKVIKSINSLFDKEAIRTIKSMPKWKPGKVNGKEEKMEVTIAFVAKLITGKKETDTIVSKRYTNANYEVVISEYETRRTYCYAGGGGVLPYYWDAYFPNDLKNYIEQNLVYPPQAQADSIEGTVVCQFKVSKRGRISRIKVVQSVHPLLDKEAVRLIKSMPRWVPARKNGKPVRSKTTLEIEFEL